MRATAPLYWGRTTPQAKILVLNSLDERYGSTYRLRSLSDALKRNGMTVTYVEQSGNAFAKLGRAIASALGDYDLLFTQKFNPITLIAIAIARARKKPVIVDWDDFDAGLQSNRIKRVLSQFCEWVGPHFVSAITTHSDLIQKRAQTHRPTKMFLQGFNEEFFKPETRNRTADRMRWGFSETDKVVGHLCTFTHGGAMDLPLVLECWADPALASMKFFLIGGGPLEKEILEKIAGLGLESRVKLSGLLAQEEIPSALNCLDVGVVYMRNTPANHARVSFKVIEYLAMNVPVVGQVVGETERLFGKHITHAEPGDFAKKIAAVANAQKRSNTAEFMSPYKWHQTAAGLPLMILGILSGEKQCN